MTFFFSHPTMSRRTTLARWFQTQQYCFLEEFSTIQETPGKTVYFIFGGRGPSPIEATKGDNGCDLD